MWIAAPLLFLRNFLGCWPLAIIPVLGVLASAVAVALQPRRWGVPVMMWVTRWWARWVLWTFGVRVWVKGLENVPPQGGCVVVSNHRSHLDVVVLALCLRIPLVAVYKHSLGTYPWLTFQPGDRVHENRRILLQE